jgi:tetratricopeptide (TPR) repeat protein
MTDDEKQIDAKKVAAFIEWVEPAIREYPPRFKDEEQQKRIYISTLLVTGEINKIDPEAMKDPELLTSLAHILGMAYNLNIPTGDKAQAFFKRALVLSPESRRANYSFGMFLISTDKHHLESLPYLEKAYKLGEGDAQFSIGVLYYEKGEKERGLKELEAYSKAHTDNEHVKEVIKAIQDGTLKIKKSPGA